MNKELRIETVVYVTRQHASSKEVLLIYRDKNPNKGIWVPLGEAVLDTESPYECTTRCLADAGLTAQQIIYKGLVTEVSPTIQWHLFLYEVTEFTGENPENIPQGQLKWVNRNDLLSIKLPQADTIMGPKILVDEVPFYEAKFYFNEEGTLFKTDVYSPQ